MFSFCSIHENVMISKYCIHHCRHLPGMLSQQIYKYSIWKRVFGNAEFFQRNENQPNLWCYGSENQDGDCDASL